MKALFRISFNNFLLNRKKSLLLGVTIFVCALLLLVSRTTMNGVEKQVMKNYRVVQAGDICIIWKPLKESDVTSPQRFINVYEPLTYSEDEKEKNDTAINTLTDWVVNNKDNILYSFPTVRRNAVLETETKTDQNLIIYSVEEASSKLFQDSKSVQMKEGELLTTGEGICLSEEKAKNLNLKLGDTVAVNVTTSKKNYVTKEYTVTGIYKNGAFYENYYGFLSREQAIELYEMEDGYFDTMMVHLKETEMVQELADNLDAALLKNSDVLRAESYLKANTYYNNTPKIMKLVFQAFIIFLLAIIALGMQSTVRMNLFQRMKEFGTLRAIGFSRWKSYLVVFFETFFVSVAAFLAALILSVLYTVILGKVGVYVGPAASALFGGEYFYPEYKVMDMAAAFVIITIFSLVATIRPGMNLCFQNILDIINKKPKRIRPFILFIKELVK